MRTPCHALLCCTLLAGSLLAQTSQPGRLPTPAPQALADARRELLHTLGERAALKAPAERRDIARQWLTHARDFQSTSAFRFAELTEAAEMAAGAGDIVTAWEALDLLAATYAADILALKRDAVVAAVAVATREDAAAIPACALQAARGALEADRYDLAAQLLSLAEAASHKAQNILLSASIQGALAEMRSIVTQSTQAKAARARLAAHPDDPEAHLVLGRFLGLYQNRLADALPHLLAGGDPALRALAQLETGVPATDTAQRALADAWWSYAQSAAGVEKNTAQVRAAYWYKAALSTFDAHVRPTLDARIAAAEPPSPVPLPTVAPVAASQPSAAAPAPATQPALDGIDLLALIDPAVDPFTGAWTRSSEGLSCDKIAYATCQIPVDLPDEFDLTLSFTRADGAGPITALLRARSRAFGFCVDIRNKARFERVANKVDEGNPTVVPVNIVNNRRYTLTLQVRKDFVRALLDGQPLTEYKTDLKDLSRYDKWKLADPTLPGLGANNARVTFHAVRLVEITGKARPARTRNP